MLISISHHLQSKCWEILILQQTFCKKGQKQNGSATGCSKNHTNGVLKPMDFLKC
jgi:hypothetical protein